MKWWVVVALSSARAPHKCSVWGAYGEPVSTAFEAGLRLPSGGGTRFVSARVGAAFCPEPAAFPAEAQRKLWGGTQEMSEPVPTPDAIEQANALFWNPPTLEELVADLEPLRSDESFDIPDLTDEEWEEFLAALHE